LLLGLAVVAALLSLALPAKAQDTASPTASDGDGDEEKTILHRGTNEFGGWAGFSPFSFVIKGTSLDKPKFKLRHCPIADETLRFCRQAPVSPSLN
jgi:hypothetical protein